MARILVHEGTRADNDERSPGEQTKVQDAMAAWKNQNEFYKQQQHTFPPREEGLDMYEEATDEERFLRDNHDESDFDEEHTPAQEEERECEPWR